MGSDRAHPMHWQIRYFRMGVGYTVRTSSTPRNQPGISGQKLRQFVDRLGPDVWNLCRRNRTGSLWFNQQRKNFQSIENYPF